MDETGLGGMSASCRDDVRRHDGHADKQSVGWDSGLARSGLPSRIAGFFDRVEPRQQAMAYAEALLRRASRGNGWQIAKEIGDSAPWRTQRLLNRAHWNVDGVRDVVRGYVAERIGHPHAVLAIGELATVKKGISSVGVGPQYSRLAGRLENCQVAMFAAYVSPIGRALVDRELYVPKSWTTDRQRSHRAGLPIGYDAPGKPELARAMVARAASAGVPFSWLSCGIECGRDRAFLGWLAGRGVGYVAAIPGSDLVASPHFGTATANEISDRLRTNVIELGPTAEARQRRASWGSVPVGVPGVSGEADLRPAPGFAHQLLVERVVGDRRRDTCYLVHAPIAVQLPELINVVHAHSGLDECLRDARQRAGLDEYEVRTWKAWYRHVTLAMLAVAPERVGVPALTACSDTLEFSR